MKVYHMSQSLNLGDVLIPDYRRKSKHSQEYMEALEFGEQQLGIMLQTKKFQTDTWLECVKWCVEGIFEYIRKTEFSSLPSRLNCNYYFDSLAYFVPLYEAGWAQESEEDRAKLHLFEIELQDDTPVSCDMLIFDEAYDVLLETQNIPFVINCARRYFSGQQTSSPIWELMSDKPAKAVKDITHLGSFIKNHC